MTGQLKSGNQQIKAFEESLAQILGPDKFPPEATGDLSDFLDTLSRGVELLTDLRELRADFKHDAAKKLLELEILISDDLGMIMKDLLPNIKKMREMAYSLQEESGGLQ